MRWLVGRLRNISIRRRFFVSLATLILVPMLILFVVVTAASLHNSVNRRMEISHLLLERVADVINEDLACAERVSLSLIADSNVQKLGKQQELRSDTVQALQRNLYINLQSQLRTMPFINSICISNGGAVLFQHLEKVSRESTAFEGRAYELKGRGFWTGVYPLADRVNRQQDVQVISYIRMVMDLTRLDEPLAQLRVSIPERAIAQSYAALTDANGGSMLVVDADGFVLSATDKQLLGTEAAQLGIGGMAENGVFRLHTGAGWSLATCLRLEKPGWTLLQMIPYRSLFAQEIMITSLLLVSVQLLGAFALFFSRVEHHTIIRPLSDLQAQMARMHEGNLALPDEPMYADEIGQLSVSFRQMMGRINMLIDTVYKSQLKERELSLQALEAQVNPHFLYNVLDAIHWIAIKNRDYEASEKIEALSQLFRHVLNEGRALTTVADEVEHLRNYIQLQQGKLDGKVNVVIDVEPGLEHCETLKLIVQPLVENALYHGIAANGGVGNVSVWIHRDGSKIVFDVEDDGAGADARKITDQIHSSGDAHSVFALKNIHDRVALQYGAGYGLRFEGSPGAGARVSVTIPYRLAKGDGEGA